MVEEGDLDDKLEDKATNEVVDDVKKVAMEGVDKERKQVAMKVANTKDTPTCLHTMYAENQTKCKINIGNKYSQTKWLSG